MALNCLSFALALGSGLVLMGCGTTQSIRPIEHHPARFSPWNDEAPVYRLGVGDRIRIDYLLAPEFSQDTVVEPDGAVSLRLAGRLSAQNLTAGALEEAVRGASAQRLRQPMVSLSVTEARAARIVVGGAVQRPGVYPLSARASLIEAVMLAGGFSQEARMDQVVVLRQRPGEPAMLRTVDLRQFLETGAPDNAIALASEDIVFVPRSRIAELDLWIDQYVNRLLPFGRSVAFTNTYEGGR